MERAVDLYTWNKDLAREEGLLQLNHTFSSGATREILMDMGAAVYHLQDVNGRRTKVREIIAKPAVGSRSSSPEDVQAYVYTMQGCTQKNISLYRTGPNEDQCSLYVAHFPYSQKNGSFAAYYDNNGDCSSCIFNIEREGKQAVFSAKFDGNNPYAFSAKLDMLHGVKFRYVKQGLLGADLRFNDVYELCIVPAGCENRRFILADRLADNRVETTFPANVDIQMADLLMFSGDDSWEEALELVPTSYDARRLPF